MPRTNALLPKQGIAIMSISNKIHNRNFLFAIIKMKTFLVALAFLLPFLQAQAVPTNLLTNPGFETGDFSGWTVGGNVPLGYGIATSGEVLPDGYYGPSEAIVRSGDYTAWAATRGTMGDVLKLSQTLEIGTGDVSIGFYYGSNQGPYGNLTRIYFDGVLIAHGYEVYVPVIETYSGNTINAGFQLTSASFNLASSGSHIVEFDIAGSGSAPVAISADDFYVNANSATVPEPATIVLFGIGLLGFAASRRKSRSMP